MLKTRVASLIQETVLPGRSRSVFITDLYWGARRIWGMLSFSFEKNLKNENLLSEYHFSGGLADLQGRSDDLAVDIHIMLFQTPAQEIAGFSAHAVFGLIDVGEKIRIDGSGHGGVKGNQRYSPRNIYFAGSAQMI